MTDLFAGPPDSRDVRARLLNFFPVSGLERWIARVWIEDGTDAEGFEVLVQASDSLRCSHPLDSAVIEGTVARHINRWSSEHRLVVARARAELGGEYVLGGDSDSLYLTEAPIPIAA